MGLIALLGALLTAGVAALVGWRRVPVRWGAAQDGAPTTLDASDGPPATSPPAD